MRPQRPPFVYLSPLTLAIVMLPAIFFANVSAQAQSSQPPLAVQSQRPDQTKPLEDKSASQQREPTAAEAMPEEKYGYRPAEGQFKNEHPQFGPAEVRTFAEQIKHVACSNFAFAAELDGQKPPEGCDKGGPSPAKTRKELLIYLRDSFAAIRKSLGAIDAKNMFGPIEGPYAGPNTRLGLATVVIWHAADHYGQVIIYMRLNGIVPPASRATPPELHDAY